MFCDSWKKSNALIDVTKRVNQWINVEYLHSNDSVMACKRAICYDDNTLKNIHHSSGLYKEFASTFTMRHVLPLNISSGGI